MGEIDGEVGIFPPHFVVSEKGRSASTRPTRPTPPAKPKLVFFFRGSFFNVLLGVVIRVLGKDLPDQFLREHRFMRKQRLHVHLREHLREIRLQVRMNQVVFFN